MTDGTDPAAYWRWLRLGEHDASALDIPTRISNIRTGFGKVRFALSDQGCPRILLPLPDSRTTTLDGLPESSLLKVVVNSYSGSGERKRFIDITCLSMELELVFADVVTAILERIVEGHSSEQACTTALQEYKALFADVQLDSVDVKLVRGLAGELLYLNELLDVSTSAVQAWRGPDGERHDFRADTIAVEVKTSANLSSTLVKISSLEQLLEPEGGSLFLRHFVLERSAAGQFNIATLAESALRKSADGLEIRRLMAELGCTESSLPAWSRITFNLEAQTTYRVDGPFPKLLPALFKSGTAPVGIHNIEYESDLSMAAASALTDIETLQLRNSIAACLMNH